VTRGCRTGGGLTGQDNVVAQAFRKAIARLGNSPGECPTDADRNVRDRAGDSRRRRCERTSLIRASHPLYVPRIVRAERVRGCGGIPCCSCNIIERSDGSMLIRLFRPCKAKIRHRRDVWSARQNLAIMPVLVRRSMRPAQKISGRGWFHHLADDAPAISFDHGKHKSSLQVYRSPANRTLGPLKQDGGFSTLPRLVPPRLPLPLERRSSF
jgi:hypothetical protein